MATHRIRHNKKLSFGIDGRNATLSADEIIRSEAIIGWAEGHGIEVKQKAYR